MPARTVTASALARNLDAFLEEVRSQGITLEVRRGKEVVARIVPPVCPAGFPIDQLDALLASLPRFSAEEADAFLQDIRAGTDRVR